jgi:hypothetical protein
LDQGPKRRNKDQPNNADHKISGKRSPPVNGAGGQLDGCFLMGTRHEFDINSRMGWQLTI